VDVEDDNDVNIGVGAGGCSVVELSFSLSSL